jgi:hypothetical protein
MDHSAETKRLVESVVGIATTIAEIINARVRATAVVTEPWVKKADVAAHFNLSKRSVDNWMKRGLLPYIRVGRNVRFRLSEAEGTINRLIKVKGRY